MRIEIVLSCWYGRYLKLSANIPLNIVFQNPKYNYFDMDPKREDEHIQNVSNRLKKQTQKSQIELERAQFCSQSRREGPFNQISLKIEERVHGGSSKQIKMGDQEQRQKTVSGSQMIKILPSHGPSQLRKDIPDFLNLEKQIGRTGEQYKEDLKKYRKLKQEYLQFGKQHFQKLFCSRCQRYAPRMICKNCSPEIPPKKPSQKIKKPKRKSKFWEEEEEQLFEQNDSGSEYIIRPKDIEILEEPKEDKNSRRKTRGVAKKGQGEKSNWG